MSIVTSSTGSHVIVKAAPDPGLPAHASRHTAITAPGRRTRLGVNFYAPVGVQSGLGTASRGYLAAMQQAGIAVCLVPVHELFLNQAGVGRRWHRQAAHQRVSIAQINADSVHRFLHFHGRAFLRADYRIGLWSWELPAFPEEWQSECRHFDEIWVPSQFCRRAVQAITDKPVIVVPHVVPADRSIAHVAASRGDVTFLYVFDAFGIVERKNPRCLIEAFEAEFAEAEPVRLILKVSNLAASPGLADELDRVLARDRRVQLIQHAMTEPELAALMRSSACYVSPHRSEGFGLTVAEAMAFGVPVIATDYGGTTDFVTEDTGFPLRYALREIDQDYGPYLQGGVWAAPSQPHLRQLLRAVFADPTKAAAKGKLAQARITATYSAAAVGTTIASRLAALAGRDETAAGSVEP